jgi:gamma-glutamylcyclotransferase (GGCT)/AIG2-like uncharacterized protein YtfP
MFYFAYGSNLDPVQMAQRCPGATPVGPAQLADHRLCFPRRSPVRGCAVASVEPQEGAIVWGILYRIGREDLVRLDEREGYDPVNLSAVNRYDRIEVAVTPSDGESVSAMMYVALPELMPGLPSVTYLKHIVDGAVAHSLPDDYVARLRAIDVTEDA